MAEIKKYLHTLDIGNNKIINLLLNPLTTFQRGVVGGSLTTADEGYVCYDTTLNVQYFWDGSNWIASGGGTGTVTGVTATSPITSSGGTAPVISTSMATNKLIGRSTTGVGVMEEITVGTGLSLSAGTLSTTGGGTVTSVGLTMPSAFSVASSPVTTSGTIAVTGAGTVSQYVRGDGTLANFPNSTGGGASVNYYLNGSIPQGTFGGDTYYQMSKTPVLGAGTNFTRTNGAGNGYIASFITDANDPSQLNIPGGNWNLEFYFQSSASGGSPQFYGEIYKVSATNVFTLVASGSANPEGITNGTTVDQYFTSISVPATTLLITDRIAVRIYVITSGRTITLHTENGNLCEVLTTFTTGLTALNGLTAQIQNFATGTTGTDFNINSISPTHTFNLPTASASNRGALLAADWTTFNNKLTSSLTSGNIFVGNGSGVATGVALGGDGSLSNAGSLTVTGLRGVALPTLGASAGLLKYTGTGTNTWTFDTTTYATDSLVVHLAGTETITGVKTTNPTVTASSNIARGMYLTGTYTNATTSDILVALDIQPTFTNTFTRYKNLGLRIGTSYSEYNTYANALNLSAEINGNAGISGVLNVGGDSSIINLWASGAISNSMRIGANYTNPTGRHLYLADGSTGNKQIVLVGSNGNVIIQNGGTFTDAGFRLDVQGTTRLAGNTTVNTASSSTGIVLASTVTGNTGNLTIYPNATAVGTAADFTMSNVGRLTLSNFQTNLTATNGVVVSGNLTYSSNSYILSNTSATLAPTVICSSNNSNGSYGFGPSGTKVALFFNATGSWNRGDFAILSNNAATLTSATYAADSKFRLYAATGNVTIGDNVTDITSAILQVTSTTKGFLPPRTTRASVSSAVAGLMIYDTGLNKLCVYNGTAWEAITSV
jgi:hypothetical protein